MKNNQPWASCVPGIYTPLTVRPGQAHPNLTVSSMTGYTLDSDSPHLRQSRNRESAGPSSLQLKPLHPIPSNRDPCSCEGKESEQKFLRALWCHIVWCDVMWWDVMRCWAMLCSYEAEGRDGKWFAVVWCASDRYTYAQTDRQSVSQSRTRSLSHNSALVCPPPPTDWHTHPPSQLVDLSVSEPRRRWVFPTAHAQWHSRC